MAEDKSIHSRPIPAPLHWTWQVSFPAQGDIPAPALIEVVVLKIAVATAAQAASWPSMDISETQGAYLDASPFCPSRCHGHTAIFSTLARSALARVRLLKLGIVPPAKCRPKCTYSTKHNEALISVGRYCITNNNKYLAVWTISRLQVRDTYFVRRELTNIWKCFEILRWMEFGINNYYYPIIKGCIPLSFQTAQIMNWWWDPTLLGARRVINSSEIFHAVLAINLLAVTIFNKP